MASTNKTPVKVKKLLDVIPHTSWGMSLKSESIALGLVITLILIVQAIVLARGFVAVSHDEYARTLGAANWAKSPYIFQDTSIWLPGHFYLLGLALKIHYDLFLTPRIVTMIFSLVSLGMLYLLARKLFNHWTALLSVLIVGLLRIHVYLSLTPLADMIYYAFIISFLYFLFVWLDNGTDRQLLIAAFMLGLATSFRYEGWFMAATFSSYLGLRWLIGLWRTRSLRPMWLLAISLACLLPCSWILRNYFVWSDPFHFVKRHTTTTEGIGPLTDLFPMLAHVELLLQNGALICLLATAGIMLSRRFLAHKIWLYLTLSLAPLVIITLFTDGSGTAYKPRFIGPYLILLTPFCAYAIYWAITAHSQSFGYRWQTAGWGMLVLISLYNLWLVYVRLIQKYSWVLIGLLAVVGTALSYRLLDRKHWLYLTLSLSPLPIFMVVSRIGLISDQLRFYTGLYFIFLALFYAYTIWRSIGVLKPLSRHQWQIAGLGMLAVICLYNLWGTLYSIPRANAGKAGLLVRHLFEEGTLAGDDKVLIEVAGWDYLGMQAMSNHPGNFILDRAPHRRSIDRKSDIIEESFLLDKNSSPHEIGTSLNYEAQVNPFSLNSPSSLDEYLKDKQIRLVVIKDPKLKALLTQQTEFKRIDQVEDYFFYYAAKNE